jgi:hypothetical protein
MLLDRLGFASEQFRRESIELLVDNLLQILLHLPRILCLLLGDLGPIPHPPSLKQVHLGSIKPLQDRPDHENLGKCIAIPSHLGQLAVRPLTGYFR